MRIGIVTYHRALNYGAVMQSLALRLVLQKMGHEVYYVDYWPDYHRDKYKLLPVRKFAKFSLKKKVDFLESLVLNYRSQKRRIINFEKFFQTHIYPYCCSVDSSFDVVIYGSDQIWRQQKELGSYNPFYFGDNRIKTKHSISYAASMGILPDNEEDKAIIKGLVAHLEKISVREDDLKQLLLSLGFTKVSLSLDPTLLLSAEEWDHYLPTENYSGEKYVLLYIMGVNAFDIGEVKKFAESKGLQLIIMRGYARTRETKFNLTSAAPQDFIRLIKNAEYVFSASFHGLAFSIIYGKQFFASFAGNAGRAESLLNLIGAPERLLPPNGMIPKDISPINFVDVYNRLMCSREESLDFLASIIE